MWRPAGADLNRSAWTSCILIRYSVLQMRCMREDFHCAEDVLYILPGGTCRVDDIYRDWRAPDSDM